MVKSEVSSWCLAAVRTLQKRVGHLEVELERALASSSKAPYIFQFNPDAKCFVPGEINVGNHCFHGDVYDMFARNPDMFATGSLWVNQHVDGYVGVSTAAPGEPASVQPIVVEPPEYNAAISACDNFLLGPRVNEHGVSGSAWEEQPAEDYADISACVSGQSVTIEACVYEPAAEVADSDGDHHTCLKCGGDCDIPASFLCQRCDLEEHCSKEGFSDGGSEVDSCFNEGFCEGGEGFGDDGSEVTFSANEGLSEGGERVQLQRRRLMGGIGDQIRRGGQRGSVSELVGTSASSSSNARSSTPAPQKNSARAISPSTRAAVSVGASRVYSVAASRVKVRLNSFFIDSFKRQSIKDASRPPEWLSETVVCLRFPEERYEIMFDDTRQAMTFFLEVDNIWNYQSMWLC